MHHVTKGRSGVARRRIAVVLDMFDVKYQGELVAELRIAARQRLTELVVFPGGWLGADARGGAFRREVFDLVNAASVDGVIVFSGCLAGAVGLDGVQQFCERFRGLPLCTIGEALGAIPNLTVDNEAGVRSLMKHLIVDHGYRRIGFIRGPLGNAEAETRHRTCCAELAEHGILLDPSLVHVGDFLSESGGTAMKALLDHPDGPVQAVVAANDYMALGALEVLVKGNPSSQRLVAVTGFDNIDEGNFSTPPLTTVEQPFAALATSAVRTILSQLQRDPVATQTVLQTPLVVRRSCGCTSEGQLELQISPQLGRDRDLATRFLVQRDTLKAELSRASRGFFRGVSNWESTLIAALIDDLRGVPGNRFAAAIDGVLRGLENGATETWRFHDVILALRARTLRILAEDPLERAHAEDLFQLARGMTAQTVMRVHAGTRLSSQALWRALNDFGTALARCVDLADFNSILDQQLPRLGVQQSFVCAYLEPSRPGGARRARLLYAQDKSIRFGQAERAPYAAGELLPNGVFSAAPSTCWVALPLFFRDRSDGFALIDLRADDGAFYEAIRIHLSVGLGWLVESHGC